MHSKRTASTAIHIPYNTPEKNEDDLWKIVGGKEIRIDLNR